MAKKLFFVVFFALVFSLALFAESYVIRSYDFDISGKTQKWVVENLIVPKGEEKYSSWEEVESALNNKQQALLNKRVFKSVEYAYSVESVDDVGYVDVTFTIVDARTVIVLPYPKYDSNYGLRLGVKYWNSNVLGTFSSMNGTARGTFMPWDFNTMVYYADFSLENLLIGRTTINAELTGSATQTGGLSDYNTSISVSNIVIGSKYSMNLSLGLKNNGSELIYSGSSSFGGLSIGSVGFGPSISTEIHGTNKGSSYIIPALSTSGIKIGIVNISFYDYIKFMNSEKFDINHIYHSTSMSFSEGKLSSYGYSHSFTYSPKSKLLFENTVSYRLSDVTTLYLYENLKWVDEDFFFSSFDTGVGISQTIHIGEHITITPTLSQYLTTSRNRENSDLSFQPYYCVSASSSGNYINWKGNFRDGISYSFSISETWQQKYDSRTNGNYHDKLEIQVHKILWGWFNPSVRVLGSYTSNISSYGSITGGGQSDKLGEYLRGVRNNTITGDGRDINRLSFVVNVNLMTVFPLPSFMSSWMDAYLNVFCDYAFTKHDIDTSEANVKRHYLGFGFEGIGVLKDYPSYPIRASLGFDARKLLHFLKKETTSRDFYEIYVGIDFFF